MFKALRIHTKTIVWLMLFAFVLWGGSSVLISQNKSTSYAGEVFGAKVSVKEYEDASKMVDLLTSRKSVSRAQADDEIWFHIALKHEARKRKIPVSDDEVREQIMNSFGSRENFDPAHYETWVRNVLRESPRDFEEIVREFIRIQKIIREVIRIPADVDDAEILETFLVQNNFVEGDVAGFENEAAAVAGYEKAKTDDLWKKAAAEDASFASSFGRLPLEAVMRLFGLSREDAAALLKLEPGTVTPPVKTGAGYALFHITGKQTVSETELSAEKKEEYRKKALERKTAQRFNEWVQQVLKDAKIKKF